MPNAIRTRQQIERDARTRRDVNAQLNAMRHNVRQRGHASEENARLKWRDDDIRDGIANRVAKYQVPHGADAAAMMQLTFGNDSRGINQTLTPSDLRIYAANVMAAQERFAGGITPRQVIDWSTDIDRQRATQQIHLAAVYQRKGGLLRYVTNAGPDSKDKRHFVRVRFLGWDAMMTGARDKGMASIKNRLANGKVRFDCDCGRHRYYYNYMAGVGNYHLGHKETRYPFIRNPSLTGIACKHVLRVMQVIQSPMGARYLLNEIKKDRSKQVEEQGRRVNTSQAELSQTLEQQQQTAHHRRNQVLATADRPGHQARMNREARKAAERMARQQAEQSSQAAAESARLARLGAALAAGVITQADYDRYK